MVARLSALRAGRTLPPGFFIFKDSWYSFLLEAETNNTVFILSLCTQLSELVIMISNLRIFTLRAVFME
jgi:hypothetical protein